MNLPSSPNTSPKGRHHSGTHAQSTSQQTLNPSKVGNSANAGAPVSAEASPTEKKLDYEDLEKEIEKTEDLLKDSQKKQTQDIDMIDYGGTSFGGSNRIHPEINGFW